jgi:hypothetical protein
VYRGVDGVRAQSAAAVSSYESRRQQQAADNVPRVMVPHDTGGSAVPPQLAAQMQQLVYPGSGPSHGDPVLGWSAPVQQRLAAQQATAPVSEFIMSAPAMAPAQHMPQPQVHAPIALQQQPQPQPQQQRRGGVLGRMRTRVVESERAPLMPNVDLHAAGYGPQGISHVHPDVHAAPHPQHAMVAAPAHMPAHAPAPPVGSASFEAPDALMRRAESAADVSFG